MSDQFTLDFAGNQVPYNESPLAKRARHGREQLALANWKMGDRWAADPWAVAYWTKESAKRERAYRASQLPPKTKAQQLPKCYAKKHKTKNHVCRVAPLPKTPVKIPRTHSSMFMPTTTLLSVFVAVVAAGVVYGQPHATANPTTDPWGDAYGPNGQIVQPRAVGTAQDGDASGLNNYGSGRCTACLSGAGSSRSRAAASPRASNPSSGRASARQPAQHAPKAPKATKAPSAPKGSAAASPAATNATKVQTAQIAAVAKVQAARIAAHAKVQAARIAHPL